MTIGNTFESQPSSGDELVFSSRPKIFIPQTGLVTPLNIGYDSGQFYLFYCTEKSKEGARRPLSELFVKNVIGDRVYFDYEGRTKLISYYMHIGTNPIQQLNIYRQDEYFLAGKGNVLGCDPLRDTLYIPFRKIHFFEPKK